jgi:hypothetical protein
MAEIDERVRNQLAPKEDDIAAGDGVVDPDDLPITLES